MAKQILGAAISAAMLAVCLPAHAAQLFNQMFFSYDGSEGSTGVFPGSAPLFLGAIEGAEGMRVRILKLGVGGDATSESGPFTFQATDGVDSVRWTAGQFTDPLSDFLLGPTSPTTVPTGGYGFAYTPDLSLLFAIGQAVDVFSTERGDSDPNYTFGTDILGNVYDDSTVRGSRRSWILYEYVEADFIDPTAVPEPATWGLMTLALGMAGVAVRCSKRRHTA